MDTLEFERAVKKSKDLPQRPTNEELLRLYGLYKQSTEGDVSEDRPGGFDFKGIAKFDAWEALRGMPREEAMRAYVSLVDNLYQQYA